MNSQWVVTDDQGNILGLPPMPSAVDFDGAGSGNCFVWHLSYEDGLTGLGAGMNTANLAGCYSLSNSVAIIRNNASGCNVNGGELFGGPFTFCVDGVADNIPADGITLSGNTGGNSQWVVTDDQGNILGLPGSFTGPDFDAAGAGVCYVYHLSYEEGLEGLAANNNISQLAGCYDLSNFIVVTRNQPAGGTLTGGPFTFCVDGVADNIPADGITLSGNTGGNSQWVVTDDQGNILGLPGSFTGPDFDAAGAGVCYVYHLSYEDGLTGLAASNNISQLAGCFDLSNFVTVTRVTGSDCESNADECTAPSDVVVDVISARKIRLDWNDVPNAARYLIEIRFAGNTRIVGRGLIRRSRVHIFAPVGRDYEFQIRTICEDGSESPFTDWIPFSTNGNILNVAESRNSDTFEADITIGAPISKDLAVFPNPVSDLLTLNYTITAETATLDLFHVSGKKVAQKVLSNTSNRHELNMNDYTNGLYLITITEKGQVPVTKRIIKGNLR